MNLYQKRTYDVRFQNGSFCPPDESVNPADIKLTTGFTAHIGICNKKVTIPI
jgi:hypothetical protein